MGVGLMPDRVVLTAVQLDELAAEHLAGLVRLVLDGVTAAGADHLETGMWCRRYLRHYDALGDGGEPGATSRGHLRLVTTGT